MPRDTFLLLTLSAACVVVPALLWAWKAVQDRRNKRADLDDTDFCGWYDTGPEIPAVDSLHGVLCPGGIPTTAAGAFDSSFHNAGGAL